MTNMFSNKVAAADRQWAGTKTLNAGRKDAAEMRKVLGEVLGGAKLSVPAPQPAGRLIPGRCSRFSVSGTGRLRGAC